MLNALIGGYGVWEVMLDLGSDVNVLPNKSWELRGKPSLVYSLIQLRLVNQSRIFLIGRLEQMEVYLKGVKTYVLRCKDWPTDQALLPLKLFRY